MNAAITIVQCKRKTEFAEQLHIANFAAIIMQAVALQTKVMLQITSAMYEK